MLRKSVVLLAVGLLSGLLAYGLDGLRGLEGVGIGALIGLLLSLVSFALMRWARRSEGLATLAAMFGSVLASFALILASMLILAHVWRELLPAASLTAVAVYLAYRSFDVIEAARGAKWRVGGGPPRNGSRPQPVEGERAVEAPLSGDALP